MDSTFKSIVAVTLRQGTCVPGPDYSIAERLTFPHNTSILLPIASVESSVIFEDKNTGR
jgi:hypothetical protein